MRGAFALALLSACAAAPDAPPPDPAAAHVERARLLAERGSRGEAYAAFAAAIEADPSCAPAYYHRAVMRERELNLQGALSDYERFLNLAPDDPRAADARRSADELRAIVLRSP